MSNLKVQALPDRTIRSLPLDFIVVDELTMAAVCAEDRCNFHLEMTDAQAEEFRAWHVCVPTLDHYDPETSESGGVGQRISLSLWALDTVGMDLWWYMRRAVGWLGWLLLLRPWPWPKRKH